MTRTGYMLPPNSDLGKTEGMIIFIDRQRDHSGGALVELSFHGESIG